MCLGLHIYVIIGLLLFEGRQIHDSATRVYFIFYIYRITGVGFSCMMMAGSVVVQQHFRKKRALSNAVQLLGISSGAILGK